MKKFIAIAVALVAFAAVSSAQPKALGLRGGYGAELSYQQYMGGSSFAELDLGMFGHSMLVSGLYDFSIYSEGGFNFYAGPGAQVGLWSVDGKSGLDAAVAGQIGFEYNFNIPLSISIDWRPAFHFIGTDGVKGFNYTGAALGVRYRF